MKIVQFLPTKVLLQHVRRARKGDRTAASEVIESMQPLVLKMHSRIGQPLSPESIQAGLIAVFNSIRRFNPKQGNKFPVYVYFAIRNALRKHFHPFIKHQAIRTRGLTDRSLAARDGQSLWRERQRKRGQAIDLTPYIDQLPKKQRRVLMLRYGLGGDSRALSLAQTGKRVGLCKARIHQVEAKALAALREVLARAPYEVREQIQEICGLTG